MQDISVNRPSAIAAAALVSGVAPIFFNVLPIVVGVLVESRGYDSRQVGLLASLYMAGHTLATVAMIFIVRRFDWRFGVAALASLQALSFVFAGFAEVYGLLGAFLFLAGVGGGGLFSISMTSLGDTAHPDRNFGLGTFLQTLIPAIIAFLLPITIIPLWQAQGAFLTIAAIALACIAFVRWLPERGAARPTTRGEPQRISATAWISLFGAFLFVTGLAGIWTFFERIGVDADVNPTMVGFVISSSLIAGGLGSLVPVVLGERWGRTLPVVLGGGLLLTCIAILRFELTAVTYAVAGLLFFFSWTVSIIYQLGRLVTRDKTGHMAAVVPALIGVASATGPLLGGYLVQSGGFGLLYLFATISTVASIVIVASNRRRVSAAPETGLP